jgi:putative ABC transport system ATP-binding protein
MEVEPPILQLQGLEKTYGSASNPVSALRGIDFELRRAEFVSLVGSSGSGKSTLLNILGCLDLPTRGRYLFLGEDVANFDDLRLSRMRNRRIGFVFQSFQLISNLTVLENVEQPLLYARTPRGPRRKKCLGLLERVGLGHRASHLPSELSGGESQRVAVARALSNDPDLLLADEPTGNLDSKTSEQILQLFSELHTAGATIMIITHDDAIAKEAPRQITIRDGRIESDRRSPVRQA